MFIVIASCILAVILYLTLHHWLSATSSHSIHKKIKEISNYIFLQEWEKAGKLLFPLVGKGKGGKDALLLHIQLLQGLQKKEAALAQAISASRKYPEELLFRLEEGKILVALKRYREALETFQVCAPILRNESDLIACASSYLHSGHPAPAKALLDPLLATTQNGEVFSIAGEACSNKGQWEEGLSLYLKAISLGYQTHHVWTQTGHAYRCLKEYEEAEKIFRFLLEKDPADLEAILGLGACLQERGHFHKALLTYYSVPSWKTKDPRLLKQAALCALYTKKYPFAEKYFWEVIQKEQPSVELYIYYGYTLEFQEKWTEAETLYLKMVHLFPLEIHASLSLAWLFGIGKTTSLSSKQALEFAYSSLKIKNTPFSLEILSACEARQGNFRKAYQILESLPLTDADPETKARRQQALRNLRKNIPLDASTLCNCSKKGSLIK